MGVLDFDAVFDLLDPARRGFLTGEQVGQYDEVLHFTPLCAAQVQAAILQVCGKTGGGKVQRKYFAEVLRDLERRRAVEERARWDFMALDKTGDHRLSLPDTLMVFQLTHGEAFSMLTWTKFVQSRGQANADVYFDEVRLWLCSLPEGEAAPAVDFDGEKQRLSQGQKRQDEEDYNALLLAQEDESSIERQRQEYREKMKRQTKRKRNLWESRGLEALLFDDGMDDGEDVVLPGRKLLGLADVTDALELKYDLLRRKLMREMLRKQAGDVMWASLSETEQQEAVEQLSWEEKRLRKDGSLPQDAHCLNGASVTQGATLRRLMGSLGSSLQKEEQHIEDRRMTLQKERKSEHQTELILQAEFDKSHQGQCDSAEMLVALADRYHEEREQLLTTVKSVNEKAGKKTPHKLLREYCKLVRQHQLCQNEADYSTAAIAVGLAEKDDLPVTKDRFQPDRWRQEILAVGRSSEQKELQLPRLPDDEGAGAKSKSSSVVDLQAEVIHQLTQKHSCEVQMLIYLLLGPGGATSNNAAAKLKTDAKQCRVTSLRNARNRWRGNVSKATETETNVNVLQEACGLYYEDQKLGRQSKGQTHTDAAVSSSVLADVQQAQHREFHSLLLQLPNKTEKALSSLSKLERSATREQHFDNLAAVLLGTVSWGEDEVPLIEALQRKYDALRRLLFIHILRLEYGIGWDRLKDEERERLLSKRLDEEMRMREDGHLTELATLVNLPQEVGSARSLLGEDRLEYSRRLATADNTAPVDILTGQGLHATQTDERAESQATSTNILADLVARYTREQDALIGWLRSHDQEEAGPREGLLPLALLDHERWRADKARWLDEGYLSVGLFERVTETLNTRHVADDARLHRLIRLRIQTRRKRLETGRPYHAQRDDYAPPEKGDVLRWMVALLREVDKRGAEEREVLLELLQDPAMEELREAARVMGATERRDRLLQLQAKRNKLDMDDAAEQEENLSIMEEAAAICVVQSLIALEDSGKGHGDVPMIDQVNTHLVVDLQQEQDKQMAGTVAKLAQLTEDELKTNRESEITARHQGACDNVFAVLTRYDGTASDDELLQALEEKYDALRDPLLLEALMHQAGKAEWAKLSEQERQRRLMELRLREWKLRREGKFDELARLLGESVDNEALLRKLMGDNKVVYERKLRERLERRKQRQEQGVEDKDEEEEEEMDEETGPAADSVMQELNSRYEMEKDALLARLRGVDDRYLSERDRQAELVRLHRERRAAEREDDFHNAAMLLGLVERQQAQISDRLRGDRERHEMLARQRLEMMRKKLGGRQTQQQQQGAYQIVTQGGQIVLQEAVLKHLDEKHLRERQLLSELSAVSPDDVTRLFLEASSGCKRQQQLKQLQHRRLALPREKAEDHRQLLQESCFVKMASRHETLSGKQDGIPVTDDEVAVTLLADLQEGQNLEVAQCMESMSDKDNSALIELQEGIVKDTDHQTARNVATVLFSPEQVANAGEHELLQALEAKYDALKEKLLLEALMCQVGEVEWRMLSEQERQTRLLQLKLEEKKLRKEDRMDEAAALLGFTEDECSQLEKEEEEEARKKRNILMDLENNFEQEKDELLKRLGHYQTKMASERQRQLELARLRRDHRRAAEEEKFETAALYLGLANQQQQALEEMHNRQEQLARERLAARLRERRHGQQKRDHLEVVAMPTNDSDMTALQEAVAMEIERKHAQERDILMEMFENEALDSLRQTATELDPQQQADALDDLRERRQQWRDGDSANPQHQVELLKEALALRLQLLQRHLQTEQRPASESDLQVALLSSLQEQQDVDSRKLLADWETMSPETLRQLKTVQAMSRRRQWHDNLATVVMETHSEADTSEEEQLLQALEEKYDVLRDKLLAEALMKELGESEWMNMSEGERQRRLARLKLEERRLRREGRMDEAAALINQLMDSEKEMQRKLGESRSEQQRRLEERMRRRKQLVAERREAGLVVDEALVDALLDQQEQQEQDEEEGKETSSRNILKELQHHYDDERDSLLAQLSGQHQRLATEQQRHLHLAKLRRQKQLLLREENFDAAAILLNLHEQQESDRQSSMDNERDRQRALARERLASKRKMLRAAEADEEQLQQLLKEDEAQAALRDAVDITKQQTQGIVALQEAVLEEIEKKQEEERAILLQLAQAAKACNESTELAQSLGPQETRMHLEQMRQERSRWRQRSLLQALRLGKHPASAADLEKHLAEVAQQRAEQFKVLTDAMAFKLEAERQHVHELQPEMQHDEVMDELVVAILADLQQKQAAETRAISGAMENKDSEELHELKASQRMAAREGWVDNVSDLLFSLRGSHDQQEERDAIEEERRAEEKTNNALQQEFEQEKQQLLDKLQSSAKPGEEVDVDAELAKLEAQQEAKRKAVAVALERQRRAMREKLDARRRAREAKDYEQGVAAALLQMSERQASFVQDREQREHNRQKDMMLAALQSRREARRQARARDDSHSMSMPGTPSGGTRSSTPSRPGSMDSNLMPSLRREKTVVDVDLSADHKDQLYKQLIQQQTALNRKLDSEQKRHEEQLKRRLQEMKERRSGEVSEVLRMAERQKIHLEKRHKNEQARQIAATKDRVARLRYERTLTMKEHGAKSAKSFDEYLSERETSGVSDDEKMRHVAQEMQDRFSQEAVKVRSQQQQLQPQQNDSLGGATSLTSTMCTQDDKLKILKERRQTKKQQHRGNAGPVA